MRNCLLKGGSFAAFGVAAVGVILLTMAMASSDPDVMKLLYLCLGGALVLALSALGFLLVSFVFPEERLRAVGRYVLPNGLALDWGRWCLFVSAVLLIGTGYLNLLVNPLDVRSDYVQPATMVFFMLALTIVALGQLLFRQGLYRALVD